MIEKEKKTEFEENAAFIAVSMFFYGILGVCILLYFDPMKNRLIEILIVIGAIGILAVLAIVYLKKKEKKDKPGEL